jgi:hypothetical protein
MGHLNFALFSMNSASKGPFFKAKKLAFLKVFRNSPAIDIYKWAVFASAVVVDGSCDQFLASTGFPLN